MKKVFTIVLALVLMSLNILAQIPAKDFRPDKNNIAHKVIEAEMISGGLKSKISPLADMMLNNILNKESAASLSKVVYNSEEDGVQMISLLVKTQSAEITRQKIDELGGIWGTVSGDIITAQVPVFSVRELAVSPEIIYVDASTISEIKLNTSRTEIRVDQLHNGTGIPRPYKGNGVVVGVLDSGIDWAHPDFINSSGNRIRYLWDMSGTGNQPSGYSYGTEYVKSQLDANQCLENDADDGHGHGTHVAGTAAGSGGALINYSGIAPESDIIFVKGFRSGPGFASGDVIDGCNYIFQKAQQLNKPAVINLSLGGHYGPHDGTSLYEQALSNLTGSGRIIVAAAGNEGGETIHLSYPVSGTSYESAYETFFELYNNATIVLADMWYSGGNISTGVAAYTSTGTLIGYTPGVGPGQKFEDLAFTVDNVTYGYITIDATGVNNPANGANEVLIAIDSHEGAVNLGNVFWTLFTFGSGTFDAWIISGGIFSAYSSNWVKPGDDQKTIGMPSTAKKVICVGSYITKNSWIDINGSTQYQDCNPIGMISNFSSIGPSRDGRQKPDIVAPGEVIVAAYSSSLTQTPPSYILQGGRYQKMQGTSMASPHVTGVVALMLEKNSNLDYNQTITILKNTARKDNFTGTTPGNTYGFGKIDAYNAFVTTPGGGGGGVQTILQEGFDGSFLPNNWTQQITNANKTWAQSNPSENNFNLIDPASQYSALCPWVAENQNEWLISPPFSLGPGNASLEFYAGYSTQWLSYATLKLHISTNGGANWTQIWTADNDGEAWKWRKKTIDLSSYSNTQNTRLGWQYIGNDGDLAAIDGVKLLGYVTDVEDAFSEVAHYALEQNYPNPFNPLTKIKFSIAQTKRVKLVIYDVLGREVTRLMDTDLQLGNYEAEFNGEGLSSGIYFYKLNAGEYVMVRKMQLLK
jgi:minor extracellular serine protease Vpr